VALALGESADARLRELTVHSVVPGADASRLLVRVVPQNGAGIDDIEAAYEALKHARSWLRQQVAAEIQRKRTPDLDFQVLPAWEAEP
jgi:ribosome-binding factor A